MMKFSAGLVWCVLAVGVASTASAEWGAECYPLNQFSDERQMDLQENLAAAAERLYVYREALKNSDVEMTREYNELLGIIRHLETSVHRVTNELLRIRAGKDDCGGDPHRLWQ